MVQYFQQITLQMIYIVLNIAEKTTLQGEQIGTRILLKKNSKFIELKN